MDANLIIGVIAGVIANIICDAVRAIWRELR